MSNPAPKTTTPIRLVVIAANTVAVYEGRKAIASTTADYAWSAEEIERLRTDDYREKKT